VLLPETKERELRFKLALRMGLPIFFLTGILAFIGLSQYFEHIPSSFFIVAIAILGVMIYFIFFLIHAGLDERITDPITRTFTREYLLGYIRSQMAEKTPYTLLLVSIDNLNDINQRLGIQNGDRILYDFAHWAGRFLQSKGIEKFPIGHFKGGDFIIGLEGPKNAYFSLLELMCLKADNLIFEEIEVHVSGAIIDTAFSHDIDQLIAEIFEQQLQRKLDRHDEDEEEMDPGELETSVIAAIKEKRFSMMFQEVFEEESPVILDCSVKLYGRDGSLIHQKKYIPAINRLGLSRAYDLMLLEQVIDFCLRIDKPVIFALPLFPSTVRNQNFFEQAQVLFNENTKARGRVMFVLEEKEYFNHVERFNALLQSYRRMGILIALDRLGYYHTTQRYLTELDVDIVRYDAFFGKNIKDKRNQAILRGLDLSAHCLGIKTWIRMIEDKEAAKIADSIGINFAQGNYVGTITSLENLLEDHDEIR